MNRIVLKNQEGNWPEIPPLIRIRVESVKLNPSNRDLVLAMESGDTLILPSPWQFVSCLEAVSSEELRKNQQPSEKQVPVDMSTICIGLEGAILTGIENDSTRMDLLFDSIRISLKQKPKVHE